MLMFHLYNFLVSILYFKFQNTLNGKTFLKFYNGLRYDYLLSNAFSIIVYFEDGVKIKENTFKYFHLTSH